MQVAERVTLDERDAHDRAEIMSHFVTAFCECCVLNLDERLFRGNQTCMIVLDTRVHNFARRVVFPLQAVWMESYGFGMSTNRTGQCLLPLRLGEAGLAVSNGCQEGKLVSRWDANVQPLVSGAVVL